MKILVISNLYPPDFLGGYELGCHQAVQALRAAGHDVLVLTGIPHHEACMDDAYTRRVLKLVDVYSAYINHRIGRYLPIRQFESNYLQASNVYILAQTIQDFRPDVAYLWNLVGIGGLGLMFGLQQMGVPWVMHLMDNVLGTLCATFGILGHNEKKTREIVSSACDGDFISCSQTLLDENETSAFPIAARTTILQNWVASVAPPGFTRTYMPEGKLRIVTAGSLSNAKGIDIALHALNLLKKAGYHRFEYHLYGMGNDTVFRTLAYSLGIADHVHFQGLRTQDELEKLYSQYDVFLFPTWGREPFGFAPMEAMAQGCLAVMSQLSGIAEWFIDPSDCVKVAREPEAFFLALKRVIDGELPIVEIGSRVIETIRRHFHILKIVKKIENILSQASQRSPSLKRSAGETYRLALLAERSLQSLIFETQPLA